MGGSSGRSPPAHHFDNYGNSVYPNPLQCQSKAGSPGGSDRIEGATAKEVRLTGLRRTVIATIASSMLVITALAVVMKAGRPAEAASRWSPGDSKDRIDGDSRKEPRPPSRKPGPPKKPRRCTPPRCKRSAPAPGDASSAEKELVLPKPDIVIDPAAQGLVGTTSLLRVEGPEGFSDYVGTEDTGAAVDARPSRAECRAGDAVLGAAISERPAPGRVSTPPLSLELSYAGPLHISCTLFWTAEWRSTDGEGGTIPDRESWNERFYPVGGIVPVLVR